MILSRGHILEDLIEHVVSCKPGFDRCTDDLAKELVRLYELQEALVWKAGLPARNYPDQHNEALEKVLKDHKIFIESLRKK